MAGQMIRPVMIKIQVKELDATIKLRIHMIWTDTCGVNTNKMKMDIFYASFVVKILPM